MMQRSKSDWRASSAARRAAERPLSPAMTVPGCVAAHAALPAAQSAMTVPASSSAAFMQACSAAELA
jgi:hypothetical protein